MGDDAYMDMCANTFRRAAEGFLDRRRKRRRVRRASAAVLVMALIPTGGVLAAQEAPTQVVDVELLDDGSAAWVEIEAGADADEVLDDLRELVRELDLGLDVREISGPPEFVGQLYVDDEASPPWRTATRLDGDTLAVSVVVAAHPDEVYGKQ